MEELTRWLDAHKIAFRRVDSEVVEIEEFGLMLIADLSEVKSIFRGDADSLSFNLMESPEVLVMESINHVAFPFGNNWYYYDIRGEFQLNILKYIGKRQPCQRKIPFVNLGIHTPFELLNGSGDLSEWVKKAKYLGQSAIGICDYNTMAATLNLQKECDKAGIKHIFGYSLTMEHIDDNIELKLYCQSQQGMSNLLRIQKEVMVDSATNTIALDRLLTYGEGNVLVFGTLTSHWMKRNPELVGLFEKEFEKVFYQVDLSEYKAERVDVEVLDATRHYFENFYLPDLKSFRIEPILICDNYYLDQDDAKNKIVLNKVASGAAHKQSNDQYFKDIDEHFIPFKQLFDSNEWDIEWLFERMCSRTIEIAEGAEARYELEKNFMPRYDMTSAEITKYGDRHTMFLSILEDGFARLVPKGKEDEYRKRLDKEIYVLESTDNVDYLLVQYDTVNWARANDILVGCGRGSAGGSLALYLLGITLIDPIRYDLLFERFLLPERAGLYPAKATTISKSIESNQYYEIKLENGNIYKFDCDARLLVIRDGDEIEVYADELQTYDDVFFDNRDLVWTINRLNDESNGG